MCLGKSKYAQFYNLTDHLLFPRSYPVRLELLPISLFNNSLLYALSFLFFNHQSGQLNLMIPPLLLYFLFHLYDNVGVAGQRTLPGQKILLFPVATRTRSLLYLKLTVTCRSDCNPFSHVVGRKVGGYRLEQRQQSRHKLDIHVPKLTRDLNTPCI